MNEDIGMRSLVVKVLDLQAEGTEFDSHQQYKVIKNLPNMAFPCMNVCIMILFIVVDTCRIKYTHT